MTEINRKVLIELFQKFTASKGRALRHFCKYFALIPLGGIRAFVISVKGLHPLKS